jgi:hypothetical protein
MGMKKDDRDPEMIRFRAHFPYLQRKRIDLP